MKINHIVLFFFIAGALLQVLPQNNKQNENKIGSIFADIENALSRGDVDKLSIYFSHQTYFSLANGKTGYFSSNQAYYILEDFFSNYRAISFKFNNINTKGTSPYSSGNYVYEFRGMKKLSRAYISLKNMGGNWKISQITIN